jgi:hypothetical protein
VSDKTCTKCLLAKQLSEFAKSKLGKGGLRSTCRACERAYDRERKQLPEMRAKINARIVQNNRSRHAADPIKFRLLRMLNRAKTRARRDGVPFDIDYDYLYSILTEKCPALGIPFDWSFVGPNDEGVGGTPLPVSPSLDRFYPELGYVRGNVHIISHLANVMKNSGTVSQVVTLALWVMKIASINTPFDLIAHETKDRRPALRVVHGGK